MRSPASHVVREGDAKERGAGQWEVTMDLGDFGAGEQVPDGAGRGMDTGGRPGGPQEAETPTPARVGSHMQQKMETEGRKGGDPGRSLSLVLAD